MDGERQPELGSIGWTDLTVADAGELRDFYAAVVGWKPEPVDMGGYSDFTMTAPQSGRPVAGICHARGSNAKLPPQWLIYLTVEDLEESVRRCLERGGEVLDGPRGEQGRFCVIRDPAGAVVALYEPSS